MKQDDMVSSLKNLFVPVIRRHGFKGSMPHFRRPTEDRINLLTVRFDRHGGGFVIEVSNCSPEGTTTPWGKHIPPNRVSAWDVYPPNRPRLGSSSPGEDDHWFRFDDGTSTDEIAKLAVAYFERADQWWSTANPWWKEASRQLSPSHRP